MTAIGGAESRTGAVASTVLPAEVRRSPGRLMVRRFVRNRSALVGAVVLMAMIVGAVVIPVVYSISPNHVDLFAIRVAPSSEHWFGTDSTGRDVFARVWAGARVSLTIGFIAALLSVAIGGILGAVAGLMRGGVESVIMRLTDISISLPSIIVIVVLAGILGPGVTILIVGIAATHWGAPCRITHGVTLSERERDYVQAAMGSGARPLWLLRKHIIPAGLPPLIVTGTLAVANAILLEAALSFLGLGVQPPQASWGNMLTDAQSLTVIRGAPWMWLAPGAAIVVTVLAVNCVGDGLRDAFDPRQSIGSR